MHKTILSTVLAALLTLTGIASAQEWPMRAVTMVVPFAAGGPQDTIGRIIMEGGNSLQIAETATREGVADLRQSGLKKVKDGITSLEEINRVTID